MQGGGSLPCALLPSTPWSLLWGREGIAQEVGYCHGSVSLPFSQELKADGGSLKSSPGGSRGRMGSSATSLDWGRGEAGSVCVWIWEPAPKPSHQRVPAEWAEWLCALQFEEGGSVGSRPH